MEDLDVVRDLVAMFVLNGLISNNPTPGDMENNMAKWCNTSFFWANQFMEARTKFPYMPGKSTQK